VVEQVLVVLGVLGLMFVAATGAVAFVVVRGVRRRYRRIRARIVGARAGGSSVLDVVHRSGSAAAGTLGSAGWWAMEHRRHRMWRAVTSAEQAVSLARRAGAPVGDLPALAQRLHAAARGVDAVLRADGGTGALQPEHRADSDRIIAAATDLRRTALAAVGADMHADATSVASAIRLETAAVTAGIRAAHSR
jgi:hypothetical protein